MSLHKEPLLRSRRHSYTLKETFVVAFRLRLEVVAVGPASFVKWCLSNSEAIRIKKERYTCYIYMYGIPINPANSTARGKKGCREDVHWHHHLLPLLRQMFWTSWPLLHRVQSTISEQTITLQKRKKEGWWSHISAISACYSLQAEEPATRGYTQRMLPYYAQLKTMVLWGDRKWDG